MNLALAPDIPRDPLASDINHRLQPASMCLLLLPTTYDLDAAAVSANYEAAKSKAASLEAGSAEAAEALIEVEVNRAMGAALGQTLA